MRPSSARTKFARLLTREEMQPFVDQWAKDKSGVTPLTFADYLEEGGDPRHEIVQSQGRATHEGKSIYDHIEDDLGLERGSIAEARARGVGRLKHAGSTIGRDGITYQVETRDHDGQPRFKVSMKMSPSGGMPPLGASKSYWLHGVKGFADRMAEHDAGVAGQLHNIIDQGHGEFLNHQHSQAGEHAHAMNRTGNKLKNAKTEGDLSSAIAYAHINKRAGNKDAPDQLIESFDKMSPDLGDLLRAHNEALDDGYGDSARKTTDFGLTKLHVRSPEGHSIVIAGVPSVDHPVHGLNGADLLRIVVHHPGSRTPLSFQGYHSKEDAKKLLENLRDGGHLLPQAKFTNEDRNYRAMGIEPPAKPAPSVRPSSSTPKATAGGSASRFAAKFARVEAADVHPDYQPTGIAPRIGHALGRIAAEGEDIHGPNHAALAEAILRTGDHSVLPILADALEENGHPLYHEFDWRHAPRAIEIDRQLFGTIQSLPGVRHADGFRHDVTPGWILSDWQDGARTRLSKKKALNSVRKVAPDATFHDVAHSLVRLMSHTGGNQHEAPLPDWQTAHESTILQRIGAVPLNPHRYPDTRPQPKQRKAKKNERGGSPTRMSAEPHDDLFNTQLADHQQAIMDGDRHGNPTPRIDLASFLRGKGHYYDAWHIEEDATRPDSHYRDRYPSLAKFGIKPYSHVRLTQGVAADGRHEEAANLSEQLATRGHLDDATVRHYSSVFKRPGGVGYHEIPHWIDSEATYQTSPHEYISRFADGSHLYTNYNEGFLSKHFPDEESLSKSGLVSPEQIEDQNYLNDTIKSYSHKPKWTPMGDPKGRKLGVELETVTSPNSTLTKTAKGVVEKLGSDFVTLKKDSSIQGGVGGFEIVTQPATLDAHKERWGKLFDDLPRGLESEQHKSTGLHVHIDKAGLGKGTIGRMVRLMNSPGTRAFIKMVAGRTSGYAKIQGKKTVQKPGFKDRDRYKAVNLLPDHTVELRIFKGTTSKPRFMAALEFADALANYCQPAVSGNQAVENPDGLIDYVAANKKDYPHLHELCQSYKSGKRKYAREDGQTYPPRVPITMKVRLSLKSKSPTKMQRKPKKMAASGEEPPTNLANAVMDPPASSPSVKRPLAGNKAGRFRTPEEHAAHLEAVAQTLAARGDHRAPIAKAQLDRVKSPSSRWTNLDRFISREKPEAVTHQFKHTNSRLGGKVSFHLYHSPFGGAPMVWTRHDDGFGTTAAHLTVAQATEVARKMPASTPQERVSAEAVAAKVAEHAYSRPQKLTKHGRPRKMKADGDLVKEVANAWYRPDGSAKTRAMTKTMILQTARDYSLSNHDAGELLWKAMRSVKSRWNGSKEDFDKQVQECEGWSVGPREPTKMKAEVKSGLAQAISRLHSGNEKAFRETLADVLNKTNLKPHRIYQVLHDTPGNVKPSVAASIMRQVGDDQAEYAAAYHGLLTNQSSVLLFKSHPEGNDSIYRMRVQGKPEQIRGLLDKTGVHSRLLVPKSSHTEVILHDPERKMRGKVAGLADKLGVGVEEVTGTGTVLGGRDAEAARAKYRDVVRGFESGGKAKMSKKPVKMSKQDVETLIDSLEPEDHVDLTPRRLILSDALEEEGRLDEAKRLREHRHFQVRHWPYKVITGAYSEHQEGYPLIHHTADGGTLCADCANGDNGSEAGRFDTEYDPQWHVVGSHTHLEGPPEQCDHCGKQIESAYGDPNAEDE